MFALGLSLLAIGWWTTPRSGHDALAVIWHHAGLGDSAPFWIWLAMLAVWGLAVGGFAGWAVFGALAWILRELTGALPDETPQVEYQPAQDALISDACGRTRKERIRDLARELGRSERAIWRRWVRLSYGGGTIRNPVRGLNRDRDPWERVEDADDAKCGVNLTADEVFFLVRDRFSQPAVPLAARADDGEESP